jgi:integrase
MRGGTRKRGDTWTWYFDAVDPATGKRRQRSKGGFRTKREAQAALSEALAGYRAGTLVEPSKLTLGAFLDEWLPTMAGNLEPNTHEVYGHYARAYVTPKLGHIRLQQLTASDLRAFYGELGASGGRRSQGLKPKTVKNVHALIHRALEDAVDQGLMTRNVAALRSARPAKLEKTERGVWTPEDLRVFLTAMAADRLAALWLLLATTGLRRSEALGLPWRAIDLESGQLTVVQRLVTVAGKPTIRLETSSPAGRRSIALDPATVAAVKAHRARQLQERLACGAGWQDHGLVFTREDGTPLRPTQLTRMFIRLAREAGLPDLTLHGLRHTYATASLQAGIPPKVVSQRLGHANTAITADLYQHVLKAMDAEAANTVARLILEGEQQDPESSAVNPLSTGRPVPDAERR